LITALADPSSNVRQCAAYSLGKLQDLRAIPALVEALRDRDAYVQKAAAIALESIGHTDGELKKKVQSTKESAERALRRATKDTERAAARERL
jgi:HEAT repeat protein